VWVTSAEPKVTEDVVLVEVIPVSLWMDDIVARPPLPVATTFAHTHTNLLNRLLLRVVVKLK